MSSIVDFVRRFRSLRAIVLGDAILDSYLQGTAERLCVEGPVPVVRKLEEWKLPGGAANTAVNLSALGAHVTFLGVVGADAAGRALRDLLRERGVHDRYLIEDETVATQHKLRILADGQYVVRFDEGTTHAPHSLTQRQLLAGLDESVSQCDVIVISDYCYGTLTEPLMRRAQEKRQRLGIPLIVDSKQLGRFGRLDATVVTPNLLEARAFVSAHGAQVVAPARASDTQGRITEGRQLATALLSLLDTEIVAVTLSADGVALARRDGQQWYVAAHPVAHPNDVGAGDSFTSALALALAARAQPDLAARIAVDAASIAVSKPFTSQVEQRELLQRVSLREHVSDDLAANTPYGPTAQRHALARVRSMLDLERAAGHVIVFTNGVFDVLHAGHIEFLRRAKALGDKLVVGVNNDDSVRRLAGTRAPLMSEYDRLALLAALEPVDYVLLFDDETPARLIRALRPHIHVKGGDYADEALPEAEAVRETGGQVVIVPLAGAMQSAQAQRVVSGMANEPLPEGKHVYAG